MADIFTAKRRSEIMSNVRSRGNRATEIRLVEILRQFHITGWRRHQKLFGKPDFIFLSERVAVFVDGCFWHGCPRHSSIPSSNRDFWIQKITKNKMRDKVVRRELKSAGWRVVRIWQHELSKPQKVAQRVRRSLIEYQQISRDRNGQELKVKAVSRRAITKT